MTRTSSRRTLSASLVVALVVAALGAAGSSAADGAVGDAVAAPGGHPAAARATVAPAAAARAQARSALADARAALHGGTGGAGRAGRPSRDATPALARLLQTRSALTGADRAEAARLLARPAMPRSTCTAANCYHWTTTGADAVPSADSDGDGVPDYVEQVARVVDHVRETYLAAGYRAPEADGLAGGNSQTDIYLADVGSENLYGYCTTDQQVPQAGPYDAWAFCVLDNDYAGFPRTPLANIEVTAAHEYFHAVQFAYDVFEDPWFMEATATWAEDELYTDVNDNLQYLPSSPLTHPTVPLDSFSQQTGVQYGEWIFFRYLTERITAARGGLPVLVRKMWERADGAAGGPDDYSMQAVENALAAQGYDLTRVFAAFVAANRFPGLAYDEGAANHYPVAPPGGTFPLSRSKKDSGWKYGRVRHLAGLTARFVPGSGLSATAWRLRVAVDLPDRALHPAAIVSVVSRSGRVTQKPITLGATGAGVIRVPFGSSGTRYVEVTLVNAGRRYSCWTATGAYSCHGTSKDDGRKLMVRATAVR